MKRLLAFILLSLFALGFVACTADYDTFGKSSYKVLKDIRFEEQSGDAAIYEDEHVIKVTTVAPPESLETWDSLTLELIDVSALASLHLVDGKFKEFPKDSSALDSLANEVSYVERSLHVGDRIRIPKSLQVYLMVIAENGDPSIWLMNVNIPGVVAVSSSSKAATGESSDDAGSEESSSSADKGGVSSSSEAEEVAESSSSSVVLNSAKDLQVTFANQLKSNRSNDTIYVKLNSGEDLAKATLEKYVISEGASINPAPDKVESWETAQTFKVTAEDSSEKNWVVVVSVAEADEKASDEKELLSATVTSADAEVTVDTENKTVKIGFSSKKDAISAVVVLEISATAVHDLSTEKIDLTTDKTFTITAEDGSSEQWTISATYPEPVPPRILSMKIAGNDAVVDSVEENGKWVYWVHYDSLEFRSDLTALTVSDIKLSEGASISGIKDGSSYDIGTGVKATVTNDDGASLTYEVRAGYQLPNSDFSAISYDDVWNNANQTIKVLVTIKVTTAELVDVGSGKGVQLKTDEKASKIASGSIYTADFNPNGVGALSLASTSDWPDGNELIDFGKPFEARPRYFEFLASYEGLGDSCDAYVILENRTGDKNVNRTSDDVNKLVASAWFRSTTLESASRTLPDLVSISDPDANGMRRIRMKLQYGTPLEGSPVEESSTFATKTESSLSTAINNGTIQGTGSEAVTHIKVVFASSADGNHYNGKVGATLIVDEMRLIY